MSWAPQLRRRASLRAANPQPAWLVQEASLAVLAGAPCCACACEPDAFAPASVLSLVPAGRSLGRCRCCMLCPTCSRRRWAPSRACPLQRRRPTPQRCSFTTRTAIPASSIGTCSCPARRTPAGTLLSRRSLWASGCSPQERCSENSVDCLPNCSELLLLLLLLCCCSLAS